MHVITMESEAFQKLVEKLDAISVKLNNQKETRVFLCKAAFKKFFLLALLLDFSLFKLFQYWMINIFFSNLAN